MTHLPLYSLLAILLFLNSPFCNVQNVIISQSGGFFMIQPCDARQPSSYSSNASSHRSTSSSSVGRFNPTSNQFSSSSVAAISRQRIYSPTQHGYIVQEEESDYMYGDSTEHEVSEGDEKLDDSEDDDLEDYKRFRKIPNTARRSNVNVNQYDDYHDVYNKNYETHWVPPSSRNDLSSTTNRKVATNNIDSSLLNSNNRSSKRSSSSFSSHRNYHMKNKSSTQQRYYKNQKDHNRNIIKKNKQRSSHKSSQTHSSHGRLVPYTNYRHITRRSPHYTRTFYKSMQTLKCNIPSAAETLKQTAITSYHVAKDKSYQLSNTLYREAKGMASSELEMVLLKATRPDDTPVKGKHVERLVGVTYQISSRYDIYDAVLRKLWKKIMEDDWRTVIKCLYLLHRFSVDGCGVHGKALKEKVRELRNRRNGKGKYFSRAVIMKLDERADSHKYKNFLAKYAHFVLLRAQCFSGVFSELELKDSSSSSQCSKSNKMSTVTNVIKPFTSTFLKQSNFDAANGLLTSGIACALSCNDDCCEHVAVALERVIADLIELTRTVGKVLNAALDDSDESRMYEEDVILLGQWCDFYSQTLLPQTRQVVRSTTSLLDEYELYLPTGIGVGVKRDLLKRGLMLARVQQLKKLEEEHDIDNTMEAIEEHQHNEQEEQEPQVNNSVDIMKNITEDDNCKGLNDDDINDDVTEVERLQCVEDDNSYDDNANRDYEYEYEEVYYDEK